MPKRVSKRHKPRRISPSVKRTSPPKLLGKKFLIVGIIFVTFWATHKLLYFHSLSLSRIEVAQIIQQQPQELPLPIHLSIPWNSDVAIEPMSIDHGNWQVSDTKASFLLGSARPGQAGNIIIYGHNKREILGNIRELKGGEKITIQTADQKNHVYVVSSVQEVNPDKIGLLAPTSSEVLTLYTCSGIFDSLRFIVQAKPVR